MKHMIINILKFVIEKTWLGILWVLFILFGWLEPVLEGKRLHDRLSLN